MAQEQPAFEPDPSFLAAKFAAPSTAMDILPRERLLALMESERDAILTTVIAPAGYGKTTMLSHHSSRLRESGRECVWLHLDSYDDNAGFWRYLCEAIRKVDPSQDYSWIEQLISQTDTSDPRWINGLINQLATIKREFTLILDDFHAITQKDIHAAVHHLVTYMPRNMRLVIASREAIPFSVARLHLQRQILEIGTAHLAFDFRETECFLRDIMDIDLDIDGVWDVLNSTRGWVAGIKIVALAIQSNPHSEPKDLLRDEGIHGDANHLFEYLSEEVLGALDISQRSFLLNTSFLSELCPSLCDFVLGIDDSAEILAYLGRSGLFVSALGESGGWYRLHPVFQRVLVAELEQSHPKIRERLNKLAAAWLEGNGYADRALPYLVNGGDYDRALQYIDLIYCSSGPLSSFSVPVVDLLSQVPYSALCKYPRCVTMYAIALFCLGSSTRLDKLIMKLRDNDFLLEGVRSSMKDGDYRNRLILEAFVAYACADFQVSIESADKARSIQESGTFRVDGLLMLLSARSYIALGKIEQSIELLQNSMDNAESHTMDEEYLFASRELSRVYALVGNVYAADAVLRKAMEYATRHSYNGVVVDFIRFYLSLAPREWGSYAAFGDFLECNQAFIAAQKSRFEGWLCACDFFLELGKCYYAIRDYESADEYFTCAKDVMRRHMDIPLLAEQLADARVRLWLMSGEDDKARAWYETQKMHPFEGDSPAQTMRAITEASVMVFMGEAQQALALLAREVPDESRIPFVLSRIDYYLIRACASVQTAGKSEAKPFLLIALKRAQSGRFIQHFIGWGPWIVPLINEMIFEFDCGTTGVQAEFRRYIIDVSRACQDAWPSDADLPQFQKDILASLGVNLSKREREVLQMIVARKTTSEIACTCDISLSTAKSHISNIYRKLGVHTRLEAIERGLEILDQGNK